MEFLRFGSSIPGSYWGCCACDIIQNFKVSPDAPYAINLVTGDGGTPITDKEGLRYVGKTYREVFESRLRFGTFDSRDMPNHAFIAILTEEQTKYSPGKDWLAILKEHGFEFIRSVSNSVYTGAGLQSYTESRGSRRNYIFMKVRNIGASGDGDSLTPPKEWIDLPKVMEEAWENIPVDVRKSICKDQHKAHTSIWNKIGKPKFYTEKSLIDSIGIGAIWRAGKRSLFPQETLQNRRKKEEAPTVGAGTPTPASAAFTKAA